MSSLWVSRGLSGVVAIAGVVLALAALSCLGPGIATAQAEPVWVAGALQETNISSCIQNLPENGTGAYLAYLKPSASTPPQTGEVWYVAVVVAGLGNTCSGTIYNPVLKLPAGTEPAISATNPLYCLVSPSSGQPVQLKNGMCAGIQQLGGGKVQIKSSSSWAGTLNGQPIAPFFPIAQGYFEEEHLPVVSSLPLSGAQKIESTIETTDEGGETLSPWVAPVVTQAVSGGNPGGGESPGGGSNPGGGNPGGGSPGGGGTPGGSGGGASTGGGGSAPSNPGSTATPTPAKPLKCKRGFKKKLVHGKPRCVKVKKHHR